MKNLDALIVFARVAEMKSFTQAAESLGIKKGRASVVVRALEHDVGATLLHRTTRTVQLTEDGRAFYSRARDLLAEAEELRSMFATSGMPLRGRLRVDMPSVLAQSVVIPALPQLLKAHPDWSWSFQAPIAVSIWFRKDLTVWCVWDRSWMKPSLPDHWDIYV
ncbi:LysR family transcriptional regulator [Atlantibacter hermannii]|uniref:LysR family transcriptional regulator n=1 Tax=Atlantibacter hermannii TaxID=565 RepID=UPI00406C611F